ncbi:hypothetical protein [Roseisolibacter agri]|uniref:Uncharacterized protein n=1 Tax=Roseisolibacter agri TaxID=2014610 RepID=A0AA37Q5L5_9BACT|nr:hypothetical protein [Roseisolibacter agri]GLC24182.1 hypothetical protein rosag_06950 [Roseisolibacter agri]
MGAAVIAVAAARAERRLVERLRSAGALTPAHAVPIISDAPPDRRRLARLVRAGAVHETPHGYWLEEAAYAAHRENRKRSAALVLLGAALAAAAAGIGVRR